MPTDPTKLVQLSSHALVALLLALAIVVLTARLFGEIARRFGQPAVLGEIGAGVLLGATVLGRLFPRTYQSLFPHEGPGAVVYNAHVQIAIILFIVVAAMEIDLGQVWRNRRRSAFVALSGLLVPFATGFALAWWFTPWIQGGSSIPRFSVALFFATALSISSLPVIIKTLLDLDLLGTDIGVVIVSSAILDDFVGWILFGVVSSTIGGNAHTPGSSAILMLVYAAAMLTLGRRLLDRAFVYLGASGGSPGVFLGVSVALGLLGAATADLIGVHTIFGAFVVGVVVGRSEHLPASARTSLEQFATFLGAPLFFASVALHIDFAANFDPLLVLGVFTIACVGKVVGCSLAARISGADARTALAIGFGMNARGAMEIVLGRIALELGIIDKRLFVALVVVALATSALAGPVIRGALGPRLAGLTEAGRRSKGALHSSERFTHA
ncbi:cation:proton antiporter [Pendulispora albinea]|uniref:Cation:proton antiporter n=1 Tax=Pendulispora albinea TaxID=2741071 RepID=A0ABZ2MB46_9BACT